MNDWNCPKCGHKMTPHGDCYSCERIARQKAEQAGTMKRAGDLVVGDTFKYPFYPSITIESISLLPKGRLSINNGDLLLHDVQLVDMLPTQLLQTS